MGYIHCYGLLTDSINLAHLRRDTLIMCALYLYESLIAFITNTTTLHRWRIWDFISHHLPFAICVAPAFIYNPMSATIWKYTSIAVLLINGQELLRAMAQVNSSIKRYYSFIPFYVFPIIGLLLGAEILDSARCLLYIKGEDLSPSTIWCAITTISLAPLYHVMIVVPNSIKGMQKSIAKLRQ